MVPWPASHGEAELSCLCIIFAAPPDIVTSLQEQQKKSIKKNHLCTRSLKRRIDVHNGADTHLNLFLFHFFFFLHSFFCPPSILLPVYRNIFFQGNLALFFFTQFQRLPSTHLQTDDRYTTLHSLFHFHAEEELFFGVLLIEQNYLNCNLPIFSGSSPPQSRLLLLLFYFIF